jgi:hypothetical protein
LAGFCDFGNGKVQLLIMSEQLHLLYQSRLVPRFVSVWGLIGAVLILTLNLLLTSNLLEAGIATGLIFALPMMTNEIFIAIWLIVKGFNSSAIASGSAKQI